MASFRLACCICLALSCDAWSAIRAAAQSIPSDGWGGPSIKTISALNSDAERLQVARHAGPVFIRPGTNESQTNSPGKSETARPRSLTDCEDVGQESIADFASDNLEESLMFPVHQATRLGHGGSVATSADYSLAAPDDDGEIVSDPDHLAYPDMQTCDGDFCGRGMACDCGTICGASPPVLIYGEFLQLQPSSMEVAFGVPLFDGVPIGPTAIANVGSEPGFRVGIEVPYTPCSAVGARYTQWRGSESVTAAIDPADGELFSLVTHPITFDPAIIGYESSASLNIDLRFADVEYRRFLFGNSYSASHRINYVAGLRYAELDQDFRSTQPLFGAIVEPLQREVDAQVDFNGVGVRIGLEAVEESCYHCLFGYCRSYFSLIAGEFKGRYLQIDQGEFVEAFNTWEKARLAPLWDLEIGVGFNGPPDSCCRDVRFSAGYFASYWFNTVTTDEFITAAQFLDYVDLGDTVSFDGLAVKAELTY